MAEQIFNVRIGMKNGGFNTFLFRSREAAEAVFEQLDDGLRAALELAFYQSDKDGGAVPATLIPRILVRFKDNFGYETTQDMRDVGRIFSVSLTDAAALQNELQIATWKGQMHLDALAKSDPQLMAFLKMAAGRSAIMAPNGAGSLVQ